MRIFLGLIFLFSTPTFAQRRVDNRDLYERLICIVPMTGSGTYADPRRPELTPATLAGPDQVVGKSIISFSYQTSDDGKMAVVELVARERKAFEPILRQARPGIQVFERGKTNAITVEAEIRKYIKDFDITRFGARAQ